MNVCIIGGGGQVAEGIGALLYQRGFSPCYYRPVRRKIAGVPSRPKRSFDRLSNVNITSNNAASIGSCAVHYRWANESMLRHCDVFIFALPSYFAETIGRDLAPVLTDRVVINVSDRFLGTYALSVSVLEKCSRGISVGIAFNSPPLLAYQPLRDGATQLYYEKPFVVMGCFPRARKEEAQQIVTHLFGIPKPNIRIVPSTLDLAFENINSILHAVQDLSNLRAGRYSVTGSLYSPDVYTDCMVDRIAHIVAERDVISRRFVTSSFRSLAEFDGSTFLDKHVQSIASFGTAIYRHNHPLLTTIPRPYVFTAHGYEDVGWSMVPLESFGNAVGLTTPSLSELIDEWGNFMGVDYRRVGRTIMSLGLVSSGTVPSANPLYWSWKYDAF